MSNQSGNMRFRHILGNKIRKLRTMSGKTQVELAKELGFTSTGTISQVETGIRGLTVESIMKAAKVLDVHPIVLLMPNDMDRDEIEIISSMFKLFDLRSKRPDQVCGRIEAIRKLLQIQGS